jgi:Amt family ammonium transporter
MFSTPVCLLRAVVCGFMVFFMQCGFALLEAGTVRAKNTKNILLKNMLDACVGALIWFSIGYMIAYDTGNGFIGATAISGLAPSFFLNGYAGGAEDTTGYAMSGWFFQYVFAAAAATIVSGAMAERTALSGYIVYTCIITAFIYPVVVHWGWSSDGWISAFAPNSFLGGVQDFAGSGIVHMTGGIAALVGAGVVGPRTGRYDEKKQVRPAPSPHRAMCPTRPCSP